MKRKEKKYHFWYRILFIKKKKKKEEKGEMPFIFSKENIVVKYLFEKMIHPKSTFSNLSTKLNTQFFFYIKLNIIFYPTTTLYINRNQIIFLENYIPT